MILPITAYGHPILRKVAVDIDKDYPGLDHLIEDMFETMYASSGVGLAAPQINRSIRLIVIDASPFEDEYPETKDFKRVFINAKMMDENGEEWPFNEGCLSIPDIREEVQRKPKIRITYYDENWEFHDEVYDSVMARILQHEYDHLEGVLFVDKINSIRKMLLKRKLQDISKGNINVEYKMIFPNKKKGRK
ncbi:MAG TPA: peptide deformylase [Bacteroidales bacterium]|nr:peptide deformylase [Bacteroidales bacterium]HPE55367.1 peptide deformylase [Bacteroidales bacterium]HRX97502.1 peptide deformylase [Bacteroidales bacterium]